jgi:hypothetical protein
MPVPPLSGVFPERYFASGSMTMMKKILVFGIFLLAVQFMACKKAPFYPISQEMKEYFFFNPGSYWIYRDNYSGLTDSVYVTSVEDNIRDYYKYNEKNGSYEAHSVYFHSKFLRGFLVDGIFCHTEEFMGVSTNQDTTNSSGSGDRFHLYAAYSPNYPADQTISVECAAGTLIYRTALCDTIDGVVYNNLIYSEVNDYDISALSAKSVYFRRNITFAKNVGIINIIEISSKYNLNRFYSLVRYKVVR